MSFLVNFFFRKEEPQASPQPPPEPVKPPNIFGGLSVKNPPAPIKSQESSTQPIKNQFKYHETRAPIAPRYTGKDPFEDIEIPERPERSEIFQLGSNSANDKKQTSNFDKKNDMNSIEFLLDLTMNETQISKTPAHFNSQQRIQTQSPKSYQASASFMDEPIVHTTAKKKEPKDKNPKPKPKPEKTKEVMNYIPTLDIQDPEPHVEVNNYIPPLEIQDPKPYIEVQDPIPHIETPKATIEIKERKDSHEHKDIHENKFIKQLEEKKRKELEEKEKQEIAKMQKILEEERKKQELANSIVIKIAIEDKLFQTKNLIFQINSEQEELKDIQVNYEKTLQDMGKRTKDLEALAEEAAGNEDFELAAKYEEEHDNLKLQIQFTYKEIDKKSDEYLEYEFKKTEAYENLRKFIEQNEQKVGLLTEYGKNQLDSAQNSLENIEKEKSETLDKLSVDIDAKKLEIAEISKSYIERKLELDSKITEKTADLQDSKAKTLESISETQLEIEELTKKLLEKTEALKTLQNSLDIIDQGINQHIKEFEDEAKECEIAENLLKNEEKLYEELFTTHKNKLQEFSDILNEKTEALNQNTKSLEDLSNLNLFIIEETKILTETLMKRKDIIEEINKNVKTLKEKKDILKEAEDYLENFTQEMSKASEKVMINEERLKELKAKMPILEIEKKNAAANKMFKEAAKIAQEIKDLIAETVRIEADLGSCGEDLEKKKQEYGLIQTNHQEIKTEIEVLQKGLESMKVTLLALSNSS
ncbi:hypothetical protein SteCoe_36298 [Stentor coeruleus]|uniref:UVR domain-containing protein n=1 Tax=Stentor coeruleus TaxID=5963 RepID=A0A1R2AQF6_9CILI|nr:hypothetical protein SteCoe_36298 [Stentor coeruleus]